MFLYEFAEKTAQKPDTVATYVRRNKKIFKNHVERRQKQICLHRTSGSIQIIFCKCCVVFLNSLFVFFFNVFFVHFGHIFSPFWLFLIRSLPCLARSFTSSGILSVSICTADTAVQRKPTILRPILIF